MRILLPHEQAVLSASPDDLAELIWRSHLITPVAHYKTTAVALTVYSARGTGQVTATGTLPLVIERKQGEPLPTPNLQSILDGLAVAYGVRLTLALAGSRPGQYHFTHSK